MQRGAARHGAGSPLVVNSLSSSLLVQAAQAGCEWRSKGQSPALNEGNPTANRTFNQFQGTLQKGVVTLYAKVTIDGAGVATVVDSEVINPLTSPVTINPSNGFVGGTVTPVGGEYTFLLQDPYVRLLSVAATGVDAVAANAVAACIVTDDNVNAQTNPSLKLAFVAPGVVGSLASTTILLAVSLANSTAL